MKVKVVEMEKERVQGICYGILRPWEKALKRAFECSLHEGRRDLTQISVAIGYEESYLFSLQWKMNRGFGVSKSVARNVLEKLAELERNEKCNGKIC